MACRLSKVILVTPGLRAAQLIQQLLGKLLPKLAVTVANLTETKKTTCLVIFMFNLSCFGGFVIGVISGFILVQTKNLNQSGDMMMILTPHPTGSPGKDLISQ